MSRTKTSSDPHSENFITNLTLDCNSRYKYWYWRERFKHSLGFGESWVHVIGLGMVSVSVLEIPAAIEDWKIAVIQIQPEQHEQH